MIILFLVYILYDTGRPTMCFHNGAPHTVKKLDDKRVQVNLHKSTCASFSPCMEENLCTFCKLDKSKRTRKINN